MDYLQQAGIMIDAGERRLLFKPSTGSPKLRSAKQNSFYVSTETDTTIQPMEECKVVFPTPNSFSGKGLISAHPQLKMELELLEGGQQWAQQMCSHCP